jgi:hypothetical protein
MLRETEESQLSSVVATGDHPRKAEAVAALLSRRHDEEMAGLCTSSDCDLQIALQNAFLALEKEYEERLASVVIERSSLAMEINNDINGDAAATAAACLDEEERLRRTQLAELEAEMDIRRAEIPLRVRARHQVKRDEARLRLKEQQYREYLAALFDAEASSDSSLVAEEKASELQTLRQRLEEQRRQQEFDLQKAESAFREEQEQALAMALSSLESDWEKEEAELRRRRDNDIQEQKLRQHQHEEMYRQQRRELFEKHTRDRVGRAEDHISRLTAQQEQFDRLMEADKQRQTKTFLDKLAKRQQRHRRVGSPSLRSASVPSGLGSGLTLPALGAPAAGAIEGPHAEELSAHLLSTEPSARPDSVDVEEGVLSASGGKDTESGLLRRLEHIAEVLRARFV